MRIRDLLDCKLIKQPWRFRYYAGLPHFDSYKIIDENLTMCYLKQPECRLNKPYLIGVKEILYF